MQFGFNWPSRVREFEHTNILLLGSDATVYVPGFLNTSTQQMRVVPNENKYLGVVYVSFYMYVYICKFNKDINI